MTSPASLENIEDFLDDFICNADGFIQKIICMYALEKCRDHVAAELSDMLAREVRKGARARTAMLSDDHLADDELADRIKIILKKRPDLMKTD